MVVVFDVYDLDSDGFVTAQDVITILRTYYSDTIQILKYFEKKDGQDLSLMDLPGVEQVENEEDNMISSVMDEFALIDSKNVNKEND